MSDTRELADAILTAAEAELGDGFRLRKGVVVSVQSANSITVTVGASTQQIAGVRVLNNIPPGVGATVWLGQQGPLLICMGAADGTTQVNADTFDGQDSVRYLKGVNWSTDYSGSAVDFTYINGVGHGNGSDEWRRIATIQFTLSDSVPNYTGADCYVDIHDGLNSWGQNNPIPSIRQYINFVNSNTGTTSNARTAAIGGQWTGFQYLRVAKVANTPGFVTFELQVRNRAYFYATRFEVKWLTTGGATVTYENPLSDVIRPASETDAAYSAVYYFSDSAVVHPHKDTRGDNLTGWFPISQLGGLSGGAGFQTGWSHYAGQSGIGSDWTGRVMRKNGLVIMEGLITSNGSTNHAFTLPSGFRPYYGNVMRETVNSDDVGNRRFDIYTNGQVHLFAGARGWYSIGCVFQAEN